MPQKPTQVAVAQNTPWCCFTCKSQTGPFFWWPVDWQLGDVYQCRACLKLGALEAGFARGKNLDALEDAAKSLEDMERREVESHFRELDLQKQLKQEADAHAATKAELEEVRGELATINHLARARMEALQDIAGRAA